MLRFDLPLKQSNRWSKTTFYPVVLLGELTKNESTVKYAIVLCVGIFFRPSFLATQYNPPENLCLFFFIIVSILPIKALNTKRLPDIKTAIFEIIWPAWYEFMNSKGGEGVGGTLSWPTHKTSLTKPLHNHQSLFLPLENSSFYV